MYRFVCIGVLYLTILGSDYSVINILRLKLTSLYAKLKSEQNRYLIQA